MYLLRVLYLAGLVILSAWTVSCGGGGSGNSSTDSGSNSESTAFRVRTMDILDPHVFFRGLDLTNSINGSIADSIEKDTDKPEDKILNLSMTIVFEPLHQADGSTPVSISFPDCSAPLADTSCTVTNSTKVVSALATNMDMPCLKEQGDTTEGYSEVISVMPPCFVTNAVDVTIPLGSVTLPLKGAQIAATYAGMPATKLEGGLLRGFVTQEDAKTITIPQDVLIVGGKTFSDLLKAADKDTGPGGADGWWFYLALDANHVTYTK